MAVHGAPDSCGPAVFALCSAGAEAGYFCYHQKEYVGYRGVFLSGYPWCAAGLLLHHQPVQCGDGDGAAIHGADFRYGVDEL